MVRLVIASLLMIVIWAQERAVAAGRCAFPLKQECITQLPKQWQTAVQPGALPYTIEEVCLRFSDYDPDPSLCTVSGSLTLKEDIASYVSGIVSQNVTIHKDELDQWVKASGYEPGDTHTIRTVTYMQANSYHRFLTYKGSADEWYPDVKCAITLQNPEDRQKCLKDSATASAGMLKLSSQCWFNQNKKNTLVADLGQILIGTVTGPVGIIETIPTFNPSSPSIPPVSRTPDLPTGGAVEYAFIYTCPDDVQARNSGTRVVITRSETIDYYLAKALADGWGQEPTLAAHLRGEIPRSVTAVKGDSYWHLAERYYASGRYWIGVAQANKWRKLVPRSTVTLPPMQELLFSPCYVHQRESLWLAGLRLKEPFTNLGVSKTKWVTRPKGRNSVYPLERLKMASSTTCPDS